jgi:PIN domain nuclease of toxin-antitoxin system
VRLLLDTHALLWWLADEPTLTGEARAAISDEDNVVAVSAATAWEMSIKHALGKLETPGDLEQQLSANGFVSLPITIADGLRAERLPRHHADPFDRMLVAQAQVGGWTVVTRDQRFSLYGIEVISA